MKKFLLSAVLFSAGILGLQAQAPIANHSFEDGTGNSATGWVRLGGIVDRISTQNFTVNGQVKTQTASDGTYFLRMVTDTVRVDSSVFISPGTAIQKFAYTQKPKFIIFDAMYSPLSSGDHFTVTVRLSKYNKDSAKSFTLFNYNVSSPVGQGYFPWAKFNAPMNYGTVTDFDSMTIILTSATPGQANYGIGTALFIDNIRFSNNDPAGIAMNAENPLSNIVTYPNPANNQATISYNLSKLSQVNVQLFDMQGRLVMDLPQGSKAIGEHQLNVDVSALKTGIYFYTLSTEYGTKTEKIVISK